jgi:hypothetical protein
MANKPTARGQKQQLPPLKKGPLKKFGQAFLMQLFAGWVGMQAFKKISADKKDTAIL